MLELRPMPGVAAQATFESETAPTALHENYYLLLKSMHDILSTAISVIDRNEMTTSDVVPTVDDIPENAFTVWKNTVTPDVRLYVNDGGTLKSVVLS